MVNIGYLLKFSLFWDLVKVIRNLMVGMIIKFLMVCDLFMIISFSLVEYV